MPEGDEDPRVANSGQSQEVEIDEHRPHNHRHKTGGGGLCRTGHACAETAGKATASSEHLGSRLA